MNALLTRLGVQEPVQAFFDVGELLFSYGNHFERFDAGFHRVPTTRNLWLAGKEMTREVIITSSAMEAIAFAALNAYRYPDLEALSFIAVGNLPHNDQLRWIREQYPGRKFTLAFGNDLLGRIADIKVASGLRRHDVHFLKAGATIELSCDNRLFSLEMETLSLSAFEKQSAIRTGIRTRKPKLFDTYLEQLKNHANQ